MGVGAGTGGVRKGLAIGLSALAMAACSTGNASGPATLQQGLDAYNAGNISAAKSAFEKVVKDDPANKVGWYNLGVIAQGAGDTKGAAQDYDKSLGLDSTYEPALYNYGYMLFYSNINRAIAYLSRAVVSAPNDANAHWYLGEALATRGRKVDNKRATAELNKALKLDPSLIKTLKPGPGAGSGLAGAGSGLGSATTTTAAATP